MPDEDWEAWRRADALLAELLELTPERRAAALAARDIGPELRRRVEEMLRGAEREDGPLDAPAGLATQPEASLAGRRFGAYQLDEEIGRGGMAVVYGAHRIDGAFEQRVAVKVLGTGLLPTSAAARFRREQELLARLRHPRIATLLDGGVAEDGTPYLVMERIDGHPIDRYCDEAGLDTRGRMRLLAEVCEAVAFAHRNLVVHRDLKPGNIFVTAEGAVKLLDFGIAKLVDAEADAAEATALRSRLLTPAYAAPEQVAGGAVTTATDVFGLGRVLERLTATLAVDRDLANIRARAQHPDPERRYADARALGEDLERWLDGRPVRATPDHWSYRVRKWAARHRAAVAAGVAVAAVGAAGLFATLAQAERARREERTASAVSDFLVGLFEASDPAENRGREISVRELLDRGAEQSRRIAGQPLVRARLLEVLGGVYERLGRHDEAAGLWREAVDLVERHGEGSAASRAHLASLRDDLGVALLDLDRLDEADALFRGALAERREVLGEDHPDVAESLYHLGALATYRGDFAAAERLFREALDLRRRNGTAASAEAAETLHHLGDALYNLGRFAEAESVLRDALALHRSTQGDDHPDVAHDLNSLANVLTRVERSDEAAVHLREALALRRRLFDESHPLVAQTLNDLAVLEESRGELAAAAETYRQALASYRAAYGPEHQAVLIVATNLGRLLLVTSSFAEAEGLFRASLATLERNPDGSDRNRAIALAGLGEALHGQGRLDEAEAPLRRALELGRDTIRDVAFEAMAALELGRLELTRGRIAAAAALLERAEAGYRERYGADHLRTARAAMWLGVCRARQGRGGEAQGLLRSALEVQAARLPGTHPHRVATRVALEGLTAATGAAGDPGPRARGAS